MTPYHRRDITPLLQTALREMPVVVLTGMRQAGKSTLLQREPALRRRRYVSLDDFATLEQAERAPESLLQGLEPITIDEAQRAPQLLVAIKRLVDARRRAGQFLLSGSANFALLRQVSESLAGRALYLTLHPMDRRELAGTVATPPALFQFLSTHQWPSPRRFSPLTLREVLRGGMPVVGLRHVQDPALWFRGYEQTYLERDVRALSQVADLVAFRTLLQLAALRTGQILNQSELGRDAKLNATTTARYLSLLETSCLINRLPPYRRNRASRLIKSPKLYLADAGLAAHLMGLGLDAPPPGHQPLVGALVETYVVHNLLSVCASRQPEARVYFWNLQGRYEVDVVIEVEGKVIAIEIRWGTRWKEHDLAGLRAFLAQTPHGHATGILAYNGTEAVSLGDRLWAVPLGMLLS